MISILAFLVQACVLLVAVTWQFAVVRSDVGLNTAAMARLENSLESQTVDRYTAAQAVSDLALVSANIQIRDARITQIVIDLARIDKELERKPPKWLTERVAKIQTDVEKMRAELSGLSGQRGPPGAL
jgi:hypothetical protein